MGDGFDTAALARILRSMPPEELAEGVRVNRDALLGQAFARFADQLSDVGRRQRGVIKWRISGADDGGHDRWFVVLRDGSCEAGRDLDLRPRVTLTVGALDFLRLVTGNADPARLVLSRRLRIRGDLLWAARMPRLFSIPR